jgi:hypothetical protein
MCPCNWGGTKSPEQLIYTYDCEILDIPRKTMKHQIQSRGGTWPTTNKDLIAQYLQVFVRFIKSIDFNKLEWN